ncbi:DUF4845 domain-containing protein [Nitrosomonas communis]|uniref:DUF4845 domain-containing protein n=1 Tax=Nitrosomonas communis TaxID=44574 RepID=UPI0026F29203|nr:DUF4845 domain-containing protein [Nitrosomonas communis]MCO6426524.1 DUF4845 domain-containing protein [Nitrosomonas communis]
MRHVMREKQQGISLAGLSVWSAVIVMIAILGMKLAPSYLEYAAIKRALVAIASDPSLQNALPREIRQSFDKRAVIDEITIVNSRDIDIRKEGGQIVLSVNYAVKTPLFANVSLFIDFTAASK